MINFILRSIGLYIPFILVILGISACSYIYKDELFGQFIAQEETIEEVSVPVPVVEEESTFEEPTPIQEESVDVEEMESVEETDSLPPIGKCECACSETAGTL